MSKKEGGGEESVGSTILQIVVLTCVIVFLAMMVRESGAQARTQWIRESMAEQGYTLILEDSGAGETWRMICEEIGR